MKRTLLALICAVSLLAIAAVASAMAGVPVGSCGAGVPLFKCDSRGPTAGATNRPTAVPAPPAYWPSPDTVACGPRFLTTADAARVPGRFGSLHCFRFAGSDRWIVVADGMQTAGDGPAPGGAIVAVESCAGPTRSRCLDPAAAHDFADFVVLRPPDPGAWPVRLQTSFGSQLLYVADGTCGVVTLDLKTLRWLGRSTDVIDSAMTGGAPPSIAAPPLESGAIALGRTAPAPSGGCAR